eukprot:scaffold6339_cov112-Isochrysis_galbana.AAC.11
MILFAAGRGVLDTLIPELRARASRSSTSSRFCFSCGQRGRHRGMRGERNARTGAPLSSDSARKVYSLAVDRRWPI